MPHQALLDAIHVGVMVLDTHARILFCNRAAEEILGRPREELVEMTSFDPHWEAVDVEGRPVAGENHAPPIAIRTGEPVRGLILGIRLPAKADRIWLTIDAIPQKDDSGAVKSVLTTFTEVSDEVLQRQALSESKRGLEEEVRDRTEEMFRLQADLRETSSKYQAVIRAMSEGVVIHEPDGAILTANPSAQAILGLSLDQMQGLHPMDPHWALTREDGSPLPADEIPSEITQKTGRPCTNVVLGVQRGETERAWLSVNTDPIIVDEGMLGVVATFTDITLEREALRQVGESKRRLERLTQAMPAALVESRYDRDGNLSISFASGRVEEVFGITAEEMMADPSLAWSQIHPEDMARMARMREAASPSTEQVEMEYRARAPGEREWRWLRSTTSPASVEGDEQVFYSIIHDVTDEHRREAIRRESQRREVMGTLAAGIAHNFNNMLAAILPSLENASRKIDGDLGDELGDAFRAASAASELVRQLASLARRESGAEFEEVVLEEVADDVVQMCRRTFDPSINLTCRVKDAPLVTMGHRSEIQQVLLNLVLNARDALAGAEAPAISLRLYRRESVIRIEVQDNGSGMSEATMKRIGQPFFTTRGAGKGTGLGVATAIGTVRDMSGTLTWDSELGVGSTFTIEVPVAAVDSRRASPVEASVDGEVARGRRIVLVDDEELVRKSVGRMLRRLGAEVVEAEGGAQGLAEIARAVPDLLLVDLSMPGMSGAEVAEEVRAAHPDLPIILMSGYLPEDAPSAATAVLTKPFRNRALISVLEEVLS